MHPKALVSVVVPFRNEERFLAEAVESVFAQTFENWELMLVDDGSTDASPEIAKGYAEQRRGRVRYLQHENGENRGISASINLGVRHSAGEFIAVLDGDDVWLPQKLEQQTATLLACPEAGLLYGSSEYWHSWTGRPEDADRDYVWTNFGVPPGTLIQPPKALTFFLKDDSVPCPGSILLRRTAFEAVRGFEECFRFGFTDQAFYAKMAVQTPFLVTSGCWHRYRQHPDSCCNALQRQGLSNVTMVMYLTWLATFLHQNQVNDNEVWTSVHTALSHFGLGSSNGHPSPSTLAGDGPFQRKRTGRIAARLMAGISRPYVSLRSVTRNVGQWRKKVPRPIPAHVPDLLNRLEPVSRNWGFDRGTPIDRFYIEGFLARHASDIRGRALEIGDSTYTRKFGGDRVSQFDVLNLEENNPVATYIADLTNAETVPSDAFDCVIVTQTLHLIYDVRAALSTLHRILKPNGTVLATFPGITRITQDEWADSWYWSFTSHSARRMFGEFFPSPKVESYGNVLSASAFLYGFALEELDRAELEHRDKDYEVVVAVRAAKQG